jgi:hypothetical protein
MPELSRFFGIIIRMFVEAGAKHHVAHFQHTVRMKLVCSVSIRLR